MVSKISSKADLLAGAISVYYRMKEGGVPGNFFHDIPNELKWLMEDPIARANYKLFQSPHLYTQLVKGGIFLYVLGETGILNKKYSVLGEKIAKGAGFAALLLPGSGPMPRNGGASQAMDYGY